jgi:hypothetical protein
MDLGKKKFWMKRKDQVYDESSKHKNDSGSESPSEHASLEQTTSVPVWMGVLSLLVDTVWIFTGGTWGRPVPDSPCGGF